MTAVLEPLNREILREELIRDEDLRLKVYRCTAGKLSIGVGRNLDDVGIRPWETDALKITKASCVSKGITRPQALFLLDNDIDVALAEVNRCFPWAAKLDQVRLRVLLNMMFNMGAKTLCGFKNTLRMIEQGRYADAAVGMGQSLWARQVGDRAKRLQTLMKLGPAAAPKK